jgi:hypothetical protein
MGREMTNICVDIELREHTNIVRFLRANDLGWMAELVLKEELSSEKLLVNDVLIHSARNSRKVFAVLLPRWQPRRLLGMHRVTIAAAQNSSDVMQLLLEKRTDEVHITSEVVIAAVENRRSGKEVIQLLLVKRGDEVHITSELVMAAAGN